MLVVTGSQPISIPAGPEPGDKAGASTANTASLFVTCVVQLAQMCCFSSVYLAMQWSATVVYFVLFVAV